MLRAEPEEPMNLPYDELATSDAPEHKSGPSLKDRIGRARVYALEDTSASELGRLAKRKRDVLEDPAVDQSLAEETMLSDPTLRNNAITLAGPPIAHLPTAKIFKYVAHYATTPPIALEWIDDTTVVLVCESSKVACTIYTKLMRKRGALPDSSEELIAQDVPVDLWPPQMRVNQLLSQGEGLGGDIRVRWASTADVKKRGAAAQSSFYKTYGEQAGREGRPTWDGGDSRKRRRGIEGSWKDQQREMLDRELDRPSSTEGRRESRPHRPHDDSRSRHRPAVTKDDLDAELDAFLHDRPDS